MLVNNLRRVTRSFAARQWLLLFGAIVAWSLANSVVMLLHSRGDIPASLRLEVLLGGMLVCLPWLAIVPICRNLARKYPVTDFKNTKAILVHLAIALGIVILHAAYVRAIRPLPEMIVSGRAYFDVFSRYSWGDYFFARRVLVDLLLYVTVVALSSKRIVSMAPSDHPSVAFAQHTTISVPDGITSAVTTSRNGFSVDSKIAVQDGRITAFLLPSEIDWIEADDYYTIVHVNGKSLTQKCSLKRMEAKLSQHGFVRIHRSYLVNTQFVKSIERGGSEWSVNLQNGTSLPVSRRQRSAVAEQLERALKP